MAHHPKQGLPIDRRHFVAVGAAGAAAACMPAWAAAASTHPAPGPGQTLVLSGRLCSRAGQALAGARIEFTAPGEPAQVVQADADGRFLLQGRTPAGALGWRASVDGQAAGGGLIELAAGPATAAHQATGQRDFEGVWRASAALVQG